MKLIRDHAQVSAKTSQLQQLMTKAFRQKMEELEERRQRERTHEAANTSNSDSQEFATTARKDNKLTPDLVTTCDAHECSSSQAKPEHSRALAAPSRADLVEVDEP